MAMIWKPLYERMDGYWFLTDAGIAWLEKNGEDFAIPSDAPRGLKIAVRDHIDALNHLCSAL